MPLRKENMSVGVNSRLKLKTVKKNPTKFFVIHVIKLWHESIRYSYFPYCLKPVYEINREGAFSHWLMFFLLNWWEKAKKSTAGPFPLTVNVISSHSVLTWWVDYFDKHFPIWDKTHSCFTISILVPDSVLLEKKPKKKKQTLTVLTVIVHDLSLRQVKRSPREAAWPRLWCLKCAISWSPPARSQVKIKIPSNWNHLVPTGPTYMQGDRFWLVFW